MESNIFEWIELLKDMLEFLNAVSSAKACHTGKKEDGNVQQGYCDDAYDSIHPTKTASENQIKIETVAEYVNIGNKIDQSCSKLKYNCRAMLKKLEDFMAAPSPSLFMAKQQDTSNDYSSYLEMGGFKKDVNEINCSESSDHIVADSFRKTEQNLTLIEPSLQEEENCYDSTTDKFLYDECQKEKVKDEIPISVVPVAENASNCPFSGLPAAHLRINHSTKYGTLFRQEKRIFFDQVKKYYVGLVDKWLLLYNNCNDLRPTQSYLVKDISLDLSLNDQINEKNQFHIITTEDVKICFATPSFKELNEWIVAIQQNILVKTENSTSPRKLPSLPTPAAVSVDSAENNESHLDCEDSIYEEPQLLGKPTNDIHHDQHNYDTPKATSGICFTPRGPTKTTSDSSTFPSSSKTSKSDSVSRAAQAVPQQSTPTEPSSQTTSGKNWLFNRSKKSPGSSTKLAQKQAENKSSRKLNFQQSDNVLQPSNENTNSDDAQTQPSIVTSKVTFSSNKNGVKINQIISQLEANGQLNFLAKSLNDTVKRNTWCLEE